MLIQVEKSLKFINFIIISIKITSKGNKIFSYNFNKSGNKGVKEVIMK